MCIRDSLSVVSDESEFTVASSSVGESLIGSTVRDTFVVFHPESEVTDTGSLSIVGMDIPMSVSGTSEAVLAIQPSESLPAVTTSSRGHPFVGTAVSSFIRAVGSLMSRMDGFMMNVSLGARFRMNSFGT